MRKILFLELRRLRNLANSTAWEWYSWHISTWLKISCLFFFSFCHISPFYKGWRLARCSSWPVFWLLTVLCRWIYYCSRRHHLDRLNDLSICRHACTENKTTLQERIFFLLDGDWKLNSILPILSLGESRQCGGGCRYWMRRERSRMEMS